MGLMDTLTRLSGTLHQRVQHSGPEAPAGPLPAVYALFMPLLMKVTLSPSSLHPCLTTFYDRPPSGLTTWVLWSMC